MTVLMFMRHAKAEDYNASDKTRALVARGHAQAKASGEFISQWCAENGATVDVALVSTAARAGQTFESLEVPTKHVVPDDSLYLANPEVVYSCVAEALAAYDCGANSVVLVVAHEPVMSAIAHYLGAGNAASTPALVSQIEYGVPTGTVTVLRLPAGEPMPSQPGAEGSFVLEAVFTPRV